MYNINITYLNLPMVFSKKYISEFVYGGIDGLVTTFSVVSAAAGGGLGVKTVLILGFANLFADGFAMSIGSYSAAESDIGDSKNNTKTPFKIGLATFLSFNIVGLLPLIIYLKSYLQGENTDNIFFYTSLLTAVGFILIGVLKNKVSNNSMFRDVMFTLLLGSIASVVAYVVGDYLENIIK